MKSPMLRTISYAVVAAVLATSVGCGPPDFYSCSGTITHDGTPVPQVEIHFRPDNPDQRPPNTLTNDDGTFTMRTGREVGVPPGNYTIFVVDPIAADGGQTFKEGDDEYKMYSYVIDRYSANKSDYKITIESHESNLEVKLDTSEYTGTAKTETFDNSTDE